MMGMNRAVAPIQEIRYPFHDSHLMNRNSMKAESVVQCTRESLSDRELIIEQHLPHDLGGKSSSLTQATIMMVDDEGTTLDVMQAFLEEAGYQRFVLVEHSSTAMAQIEEFRPDILLLDLMMPEVSGFEILQQVRAHSQLSHLPVIILTSSSDPQTKLMALEYGATDFLAKPVDPSELTLRVRNTLAAKAYQNQLAYYDALTQLPNRNLFLDRLSWFLQQAERYKHTLVILHITLQQFKRVSSVLGPKVGDQVIKQVADRIHACIRGSDMMGHVIQDDQDMTCLFRFSGEEFTVVCPRVSHPENAIKIASRIIGIMEHSFEADRTQVNISPNIGIATYPTDARTVETLVQCAIGASAQVETKDKGGFEFYSHDLNTRSYERLKLEAELRKALIEDGQFLLYYQPKVNVKSGQIKGVEALIRWQPADGPLKFPDQFIPLAEEVGLIKPIGDWVLREACAQLARWQAQGLRLQMAVNISAKQFHDENFVDLVNDTVKSFGVKEQYLTLEMTETLLMDNAEQAVKTLKQLMALGVKISMDDFGTGYSSLSYLKQFPIHELKIDRSFLKDITENSEDRALVAAMIYLGHEFNLKVVAEGVETPEQLEMLLGLDCEEYQGYLFSRPVPASDLAPMLMKLPIVEPSIPLSS